MIWFSASLVVVAIGLLAAGAVTSQLALVYLAIAVSIVALIALAIGIAVKRGELFGQPAQGAPGGVAEPGFEASRAAVPEAVGAAAGVDREQAERVGVYERDTPGRAGYQETGSYVREFYYSGSGGFTGQGDHAGHGGFTGQGDHAGRGGFAGQSDRAGLGSQGAYGWQDDPDRSAGRDRDGRQRERGDRQREYEARPVEDRPGERWTRTGMRPGQESETATGPGEDVGVGVQAREAGAAKPGTGKPLSAGPGEAPGGAQAGEEAAGGAAPSQSLAGEHSGPAEDTAGRGPDSPDPAERPAASAEANGAGLDEGAGPGKSTGPAGSAGPAESPASVESSPASVESSPASVESSPASVESSPASVEQIVTVVPGVPRYHRAECILIRFMGEDDLERTPLETAREAGCTPCRACQPDG